MTYSKKFENRINKLGLYGKNVRVRYCGRKYVVDDPETFEIFEIFKNFDEIDNYLVTKEFEQIEKEADEILIEEVEEEINTTNIEASSNGKDAKKMEKLKSLLNMVSQDGLKRDIDITKEFYINDNWKYQEQAKIVIDYFMGILNLAKINEFIPTRVIENIETALNY